MNAALSAIFMLDPNTRTFRLATSTGFSPDVVERASAQPGFRLGEERGLVGLVGARMRSLSVPNVLTERRWAGIDPSIRSAYLVPLAYAGNLFGVLALYARRVDAFPEELLQRLPHGAAAKPAYDAVLLDFRLPGLNALDLLHVLRTERKLRIPIVLLTADSDGRIAAQAFQFGASEYIVKHPGYLYALPAFLEKGLAQAVRTAQ